MPIWGLKLTMWMISNNFWRQKFSTFFHFGGLPRIPISHNSKNHLFKLFHRSQFSIFLPWPGSFRRLDFAHTRINRLLAISIPQRLCRFFPKKSTFWVFGEFPSHTFFFYRDNTRIFNVFALYLKNIKISIPNFINIFGHHVKHQKREPQGVHRQLEGFNRNLQTTTIWHPHSLVAKCIIPLLLFCQNLGQIGTVLALWR